MKEVLIGSYNFNVLRCLIEELNLLQINAGVEVGVFDGGTSLHLLKSFPTLRLFSVDPLPQPVYYRMNPLTLFLLKTEIRLVLLALPASARPITTRTVIQARKRGYRRLGKAGLKSVTGLRRNVEINLKVYFFKKKNYENGKFEPYRLLALAKYRFFAT